jgi:hypothetical protein
VYYQAIARSFVPRAQPTMVGYPSGLDTKSTDPENPRPPKKRSCLDNCCSVCLITLLVLVVGLTFGLVFGLPHRRYSVTINYVSGLDLPPSKNLTLDPQFNLTLRLASTSPGRSACMDEAPTCPGPTAASRSPPAPARRAVSASGQ